MACNREVINCGSGERELILVSILTLERGRWTVGRGGKSVQIAGRRRVGAEERGPGLGNRKEAKVSWNRAGQNRWPQT